MGKKKNKDVMMRDSQQFINLAESSLTKHSADFKPAQNVVC